MQWWWCGGAGVGRSERNSEVVIESGEMVLGVGMEVVDIRERQMEVLERTVLVVSWW